MPNVHQNTLNKIAQLDKQRATKGLQEPVSTPYKDLQSFLMVHHKAASVYIARFLEIVADTTNVNAIDLRLVWKHYHKQPPPIPFTGMIEQCGGKETVYFVDRARFVPYQDMCVKLGLPYRVVFIVRDPRDTIISDYFSVRYSHPPMGSELAKNRQKLSQMDMEQGLHWCIERYNQTVGRTVSEWLENRDKPDAVFLPYELMVQNSYMFFSLLLRHLGYMPPGQMIHDILKEHNFETLSGRSQGQEDQKSHYRKGIVGDWKNYFTSEHMQKFLSLDNCKRVLFELGYSNHTTEQHFATDDDNRQTIAATKVPPKRSPLVTSSY